MAEPANRPSITIGIKSDTRAFQHTCRVVAKHMTALADELAALEGDEQITLLPDVTSEEAAGQHVERGRFRCDHPGCIGAHSTTMERCC